jgi:hypothetical protein
VASFPAAEQSEGVVVSHSKLAIVAAACLEICALKAQAPNPDPVRFENDIAAFESEDRLSPPPRGAMLFVGSSSIRYWDVAAAFPGIPAIKRGFGGSQVSDNIYFADRIVVRYQPRLIVFYAGDADVAGNKNADQIAQDYKAFISLIHGKLPATPMVIIGIKPSPAHWGRIDVIRRANQIVKGIVASDPLVAYADVEAPLLGADGKPRPEFYADNGLNLNERGYVEWTKATKATIEASWSRSGRK